MEDNLFKLHEDLLNGNFKLNPYEAFSISDPKPRRIHKASVRDRVLNQAIFRVLYPIFDHSFIYDSYSSRKGKGTHIGVQRLFLATRKISTNWNKSSYVLKCDIEKFFDSVVHDKLISLVKRKVSDILVLELLEKIIRSFEKTEGRGIPLGNVTSQLFSNIYLNEFDRFVKHELKAQYYFRYADDFVILAQDKMLLIEYEKRIREFLQRVLFVKLHENKVEIRKVSQGIDFLGYVVLPHTLVLRTKTRNRILKNLLNGNKPKDERFFQKLDSYLGVLKHCRSWIIKREIFEFLIEK